MSADTTRSRSVYTGLLQLGLYFNDMARQIYILDQSHHRPNPDRIVISAAETAAENSYRFPLNKEFSSPDEKEHKLAFHGIENDVGFEEFSTFLAQNQIKDIALFQRDSSARVWLGRSHSDELLAIRIPSAKAAESRINAPFVVQPLATMPMNSSDPDAGKIEILPYRPVVPHRGFIAIDRERPGHDYAMHGEFAIVSSGGFRQETDMPAYEAGLEALVTTLRLSGFKIAAARDIAVSPEGWPVFVDPDTVQPGSVPVEEASDRLIHFMRESNLHLWDQRALGYHTLEDDEMSLTL